MQAGPTASAPLTCVSKLPACSLVSTVTMEDTGVEASVAWGGELSLLVRREVPG